MNQLFVAPSGLMVSSNLLELVNKARVAADERPVRHNDFVARCRDELDGEHYESFVVQNSNKTNTEYLKLTEDQCKLVAMRESKSVRRAVLEELKRLHTQKPELPDFSNPAAAARAWAEEFELKQAAEQALAIAAPKAEFVDKYVDGTGLKGFRQVAKLLKAKEPGFRQFLVDSQIMYRLGKGWTAYANHLEAGRFEMKTGQGENGHDFMDAKFTPKGITWIAGLWAQHKLEIEA